MPRQDNPLRFHSGLLHCSMLVGIVTVVATIAWATCRRVVGSQCFPDLTFRFARSYPAPRSALVATREDSTEQATEFLPQRRSAVLGSSLVGGWSGWSRDTPRVSDTRGSLHIGLLAVLGGNLDGLGHTRVFGLSGQRSRSQQPSVARALAGPAFLGSFRRHRFGGRNPGTQLLAGCRPGTTFRLRPHKVVRAETVVKP